MNLKNMYHASLCKKGILGGILYVKENEITFCTNKLTVSEEIRRLHIPYKNIQLIEPSSFHTVLVHLKDGTIYRFIIFSRKKFLSRIDEIIKM